MKEKIRTKIIEAIIFILIILTTTSIFQVIKFNNENVKLNEEIELLRARNFSYEDSFSFSFPIKECSQMTVEYLKENKLNFYCDSEKIREINGIEIKLNNLVNIKYI